MSVKVPLIPINRGSDVFYRYKMQRLVSKIVSRENGVRTLIPNSRTISRQISRPHSSLAHWFSYSLGAPSQIGPKNDEEILINGDFHNDDLQRILYDFIDRFVLCPICQNPETLLILNNDDENYISDENETSNSKKNEASAILIHCKSCGNVSDISNPNKIQSKMINYFVKIFSSNDISEIDNNRREKRRISDMSGATTDSNASFTDMSSKIDVNELNSILKQFGGLAHYENDLLTMTPEMQDHFYDTLCGMIRDQRSNEELFAHYLSSQKYKITESTRVNWYFLAFFENEANKNGELINQNNESNVNENNVNENNVNENNVNKNNVNKNNVNENNVNENNENDNEIDQKAENNCKNEANKKDFALIDTLKERRELFAMILQDEDSQKKFLSFFAANLEEKRCHLLTSAPVLWDTIYRNEIVELPAFISWYKKPITRIEKDKDKALQIREIVKPFMMWLAAGDAGASNESIESENGAKAEEGEKTVDFEKSDDDCIDIDAI